MSVELDITSNFTFLTGGSHPEDHVARAAELGLGAVAIADENSVAGIVRAHVAARDIAREVAARAAALAVDGPIGPPLPPGHPHRPSAILTAAPRLIPAARLVLRDGVTLTALPRDRAAWGRLSRLISRGRLRAEKGDCDLTLADLEDFGTGLEIVLHPPRNPPSQRGAGAWRPQAERLTRRFPGQVSLLMAPRYDGLDSPHFDAVARLGAALG